MIPDHQSDGFQSPYKFIPLNYSLLDSAVDFSLSGFARWDGQYFLHLATLGYTHENCLAFFPAYPILLRLLAQIISFISFYKLTDWNSVLVSSIVINNISFSVAARFLYLITQKLFKNPKFALLTWKVFCISPATIFFLAPYTESLFSALTFAGIYYCTEHKFVKASAFFAFSGATRSNGLVNVGFLLYFAAQKALTIKWKNLPVLVVATIFSVSIAVTPFLCYQYYAFRLFCFKHPNDLPIEIYNYLHSQNLTIPGENIPQWCEKTIPFSYSVIQSQYWDVGLLRYFTWKQIPNFLLASPVLLLVFLYSFSYVNENLQILFRGKSSNSKHVHPIFRRDIGVFAAHSMFLGLFTFFFAHVQVNVDLPFKLSIEPSFFMCWLRSQLV